MSWECLRKFAKAYHPSYQSSILSAISPGHGFSTICKLSLPIVFQLSLASCVQAMKVSNQFESSFQLLANFSWAPRASLGFYHKPTWRHRLAKIFWDANLWSWGCWGMLIGLSASPKNMVNFLAHHSRSLNMSIFILKSSMDPHVLPLKSQWFPHFLWFNQHVWWNHDQSNIDFTSLVGEIYVFLRLGSLEHDFFFLHILGMSSSQPTLSYFSEE